MPSGSQTTVPVPEWVREKALPRVGEAPSAIVLMKRGGLRKSALVFTENGTFVVEKRFLKGLKMYRTEYPAALVVRDGNCPHCGHGILSPQEIPAPAPTYRPRFRAKPARRRRRTTGPYRYRGYTLHKSRRGNRYFFAKGRSRSGTPTRKPRGYRVKKTSSGLPVLART